MAKLPNLLEQREGLTTLLDYTGGPGDSPTYVGFAEPGSGASTALAIWKIMKLVYSGSNLVSLMWADGNTKFDNVWDDHASLSYS